MRADAEQEKMQHSYLLFFFFFITSQSLSSSCNIMGVYYISARLVHKPLTSTTPSPQRLPSPCFLSAAGSVGDRFFLPLWFWPKTLCRSSTANTCWPRGNWRNARPWPSENWQNANPRPTQERLWFLIPFLRRYETDWSRRDSFGTENGGRSLHCVAEMCNVVNMLFVWIKKKKKK
ncbi:hypothetical protein IscW_ISCW023063 [Ixodes scapularis]|uniref:Uncharacterized protein n=1 Tax=Ixodes scapularis TaxID=6945 RepID=B7QLX6_IXOSC|nr:hypothetical protein IscW_ISCW023063 [Ixodes scapularis]|eukprot:XP_002416181.1 hypothetical protein IscW_ISCW023063 [Ixodes scapularis]